MRQFSEKDLPIRQQMTVYGELDAVKLREQEALEEIEKLKALLAEKKS